MPLDNDQITEIRRLLEQRRESLTDQRESATDTNTAKKKAKKTTKSKAKKTAPRRKLNPIESAVAHELSEVDNALKRLETQEHRFGYCERCFMEIPWSELVSSPARRFCSRCS